MYLPQIDSDKHSLHIPDLFACLRNLIAQVPAGRVTTYGRLAQSLGDPVASRWVGHFALHHVHGSACCCHRLVRATGHLGLYAAGDAADKANRLRDEGVEVIDSPVGSRSHGKTSEQSGPAVDIERFAFDDFQTARPLAALRELQNDLAVQVRTSRRARVPKLVGGVDVSYGRGDCAAAAYALVDSRDGRLVWSTALRRRVGFPYISTYLTFRELPLHLELLEKVRQAGRGCEVLLVDGTGILHPRRAGIASHLGVAAAQPAVGVIKKQLCGSVDLADMQPLESRPVILHDRPVGAAIRCGPQGSRTIFVSPGHRVDVDFAAEIARRLLFGRRLPAPLYHADKISRAAAKDEC